MTETTPLSGELRNARPARAWSARALPAFVAAYGAGYIAWLLTGIGSGEARSVVANLVFLPLALISAAVTWQIARVPALPARQRTAWRLMTAACGFSAAGEGLWAIDAHLLGRDPAGGLANLGYLAVYPTVLVSLMLLPEAIRSRRDWVRFGLEAATVLVGGAMAIWHFVVTPAVGADGPGRLALAISLSYPIGDLLVLLGIAAILLRCPRGPRQRPLLILAGAFVAMMLADLLGSLSLTGATRASGLHDVPYLAAWVLFVLAVTSELRRLRRDGGSDPEYVIRPVGGLPYVSIALGYGLMLVVAWQQAAPGGLFPLIIGGVSLTILVLARQVLAIRDTIRLQRERALLAADLRFKSVVQHATDLIFLTDEDWTVRYVNPAAADLLGCAPSEIVGECLTGFVHPEDAGDAATRLRDALQDARRTVVHARWRLRRADGTYIETENTCTNLLADEHVRGMLLATRDISDRCALEAQLVHQAFHDPLTGLANRALFQDRVRHALSRRRGDLSTLGVLYADLDEFKEINDTLGHAAGDALLHAVAERLLSFLRAFDTAARLGGDEFAVLIDDIRRHDDVTAVAERIRRSFREPFIIDGREVLASASVGIALAAPDDTAEDLLRNADLAMYLAKQRGRAQTAIYEPGMQAAALNRLELQEDLKRAMERGELALAYQPIHDLETQALVGAEALLRWTHPTRGPVPPIKFVPIAEETGLIVPIGGWVLRQACADAEGWRARMPDTPLRVSVNLSGRQIPEPDLAAQVSRALADTGLPPRMLVLELTERTLLQHDDLAISVMHQLKATGVRLAIDDFGTGYSSLSYLQRLPVDILKIDRAFVTRLEEDDEAASLTRTIVTLGRAMSLRTIAEGIETARQAERLRELGCEFGQGYFYGPPMPAADLEAYAARWTALTI
jgi:diguanylate cyclase (GGDEF)-like protein/PAS domain S-box-containing protein